MISRDDHVHRVLKCLAVVARFNTLRISIVVRLAAIHGNGHNFCVGGVGVIPRVGHVRWELTCLVVVARIKIP